MYRVFLTSDDEDVLATPTSSRAPPSATSPKRRYSILDDSDSEAVDDARPPLFRARERTASPDVDPFGRRPRNSGANAARYAAAAPGGDGNSSDDGDDSDGGDRPNHAEQGRGAPRNRRAEGDDRATSPGAGHAQPNIDPVRLVRPDQVRDFVRLFGAEGTVFRDEIGSTYTVAKAYKRYHLTTLMQDGDEHRMPLLPLDGTYQHHVRDAAGIRQQPWKLIAVSRSKVSRHLSDFVLHQKRCDDAMLQTGLGVEISRYGKWKRIPNDLRE